jgi:hypothetical protein
MTGRRKEQRGRGQQDFGPDVTVTRHAVKRFSERGRTILTGSVEATLRNLVEHGIDEDRLLEVEDGTHLLPVRGPQEWLCLVVGIDGPRLKPYAAVVYTVLTSSMAIEAFGHVTGLISAMREDRLARTA